MTTAANSFMKLLICLSAAFLLVSQAQAQNVSADIANGMTAEQAAQAALTRGESLEFIAEQLYAEGETVESVTVALAATGASDQAVLQAMIATRATANLQTPSPAGTTFESRVANGFVNAGRSQPPQNMFAAASATVVPRPPFIPPPAAPPSPFGPGGAGTPPGPGGVGGTGGGAGGGAGGAGGGGSPIPEPNSPIIPI